MKHIHESLPGQGCPKFIARIWKSGCLVFYDTIQFDPDTKKTAKELLKARVGHFKQENRGLFCTFKVTPTKQSQYGVVGVFKYNEGKKQSAAYAGSVQKNKFKIELAYSIKFFGDDIALDLAIRTSKLIRICINYQELIDELNEYREFKKKLCRFRLAHKKEKASFEIIEHFEVLENKCKKYKIYND